jgi:hypothetical protein
MASSARGAGEIKEEPESDMRLMLRLESDVAAPGTGLSNICNQHERQEVQIIKYMTKLVADGVAGCGAATVASNNLSTK